MKYNLLLPAILFTLLSCSNNKTLKGYHEADCVDSIVIYEYQSEIQNPIDGHKNNKFYRVIKKVNDSVVTVEHYIDSGRLMSTTKLIVQDIGVCFDEFYLHTLEQKATCGGYRMKYLKEESAIYNIEIMLPGDTSCMRRNVGKEFLRFEEVEHRGITYDCAVFSNRDTFWGWKYACGDERNFGAISQGEIYYAKGLGYLKDGMKYTNMPGYENVEFLRKLSQEEFEKLGF